METRLGESCAPTCYVCMRGGCETFAALLSWDERVSIIITLFSSHFSAPGFTRLTGRLTSLSVQGRAFSAFTRNRWPIFRCQCMFYTLKSFEGCWCCHPRHFYTVCGLICHSWPMPSQHFLTATLHGGWGTAHEGLRRQAWNVTA